MKSVSGTTWKIKSIPERLILKKKQVFNTSFLLSKILLEKKYSIQEINNSLNTKLQIYDKIDLWDGKTSERIYQELN